MSKQLEVPSFNDLAKQLDPMMPAKDYDSLREKYFVDHVAPKVQNKTALPKIWEEFRTKTERQPLLSTIQKLDAQVQLGINSFVKEMIAPIPDSFQGGQLKKLKDAITVNDENLIQMADREGFGTAAPQFVGSMIGMIPPAVALSMAASPAASLLANAGFKSARTIELANRALRGGLGFAAYEAAADQSGDRLMSGLKGFGIGAAGDLLLGLPSYLRSKGIKEGTAIAKAALEGKPIDKPASEAVAEYINNQAAVSAKEGNPNIFLVEDEKIKGVRAWLSDPDGRSILVPFQPGREADAHNTISRWLDKGGTLDTFSWHPDNAASAQKIVRELADRRNFKYDAGMFLRTQEGKNPELVAELAKRGVAAEEKSGMVSVPVEEIRIPKQEAKVELVDTPEIQIEAEAAKANVLTQATAKERIASGEMPKMSKVQAANIIKGFGGDPAKADLEAVMYMGEEELNRLYEVVQKQKVHQTGAEAGIAEEKFGTGGDDFRGKIELVPKSKEVPSNREASLLQLLGVDETENMLVDIPVKGRPGLVRAVVPKAVMQVVGNGIDYNALTWANWQTALSKLGVTKDELKRLEFPNSPMIIFRQGVERNTIYHEGIHANLVNAEINPVTILSPHMRGVATELVQGLGILSGYKGMSFGGLLDEAFTYASQAVRFSDRKLMEDLVKMDGSEAHIRAFVNDTSKNLLKALPAKLDSPGVRIFQRRLEDLVRRTDDSIFAKANEGLRASGDLLSYSPDSGTWSIPTRAGEQSFRSLNDAWDYIEKFDTSDYSADPSFWAQVRGARGSFTAGPPPGKNLPLPDSPLVKGQKGLGWTAINGWFRPFLPWVATLDRQVNFLAAKTNTRLPIFEAVKSVDNAVREGEQWLSHYTEKFGDVLSKFSHEKQVTLFELLSMRPEDWEKASLALKLTGDEVKHAGELVKVAKDFQGDTSINVLEYLQNYYPRLKHGAWQADAVPGWGMLKNPRSQGFWEKAVQSGDLNPSDPHMGRFLKWTLKSGYEKKFTGRPLDALSKLVDLKAKDGSYVLGATRWPLQNYVKYMKGVPDTSAQAINKAIGDFQGFVSAKFKAMNQHLPEGMKLPEEFGLPSQAVNKLMLLSYAGGLALRPAVTVRDALQVFITGMPVLGPTSFAKGLARTLTREGWDFAERNGSQLRKTNVAELYGDIYDEMPLDQKGKMAWVQRIAQRLLGPSRWGNNLARASVFNGGYVDALDAVTKFQKGLINQDEFLKASHAWFLEPQLYSKFLVQSAAKDAIPHEVARQIALELVDATQWAYRRGAQPAMLKTGLGRILGQYGSWPLNYAEFLTGVGKKYSTFPKQALGVASMWTAVNYGASAAMEGIGADSSKWLWTSPAGYSGGPQVDLLRDLTASIGSDEQAKSARARVLRFPFNFVPASIAFKSMLTALDKEEDLSFGGKGFIRMMGFRPLEEINKDQDLKDWLLEESGLTANPYKNRF